MITMNKKNLARNEANEDAVQSGTWLQHVYEPRIINTHDYE